MAGKSFDTPILLVIFNRPDLTRQVIDRLREIKPTKLYVGADAPRPHKAGEEERCRQARAIATTIDWPCQVKTLFQSKNLGCQYGPFEAIDWFFKYETEGIILEDDVVADVSFFEFCRQLLERYRHDTRIASISGNNFQFGRRRTKDSYYFSRYSHTCGWASWRRSWQLYDLKIKKWPELRAGGWLNDVLHSQVAVRYWRLIFDGIYHQKITTAWDYQWTFMCWSNSMLSILPNVNLIKNIGFGVEGATHTHRQNKFSRIPVERMAFPLQHPSFVIEDLEADSRTQRNNYPLWKEVGVRVLNHLKFPRN